jgi:cytochrome P450
MPDKFWPERWLTSAVDVPIHNASAFMPFSIGPANCAGKAMALQELRMVVCAIVQRFDLRFADGYRVEDWEETLRDWFVLGKGKLPCILRERTNGL